MAGKKQIFEGVDLSDPNDVAQFIGRELLRSADSPNLLRYQPHKKQKLFHKSKKKLRLYIGGNRSGKTTGGVVEDLWWAQKRHPYMRLPIAESEPCRGRVIAVDFTNGIDKIILPQFAQWTPKSMLIKGSWTQSYDKAHKTLHFANGSFVEFMSYDQDLDKFAGTSRHFIHFDEEPPQVIWNENRARLIDTGGHSWITMTPVEGMTWMYDQVYEPGILGNSRIDVIEVDMTDNPHLSQSEIDDFISGLDDEEIAARVHGKFIQLGGLIYKQFDPRPGGTHIIKGHWEPDWSVHELHVSLDHGLNNPTAVGFHAVDSDGNVVTFREYYKTDKTVPEHALALQKILISIGVKPATMIADPAIKQRDANTGTSIQQEYSKYGLYWALGNNDVQAGINRVKQYMRPHPRTGIPRWRMTEDVPNHIREHARYRWKTYDTKKKNYENNAFEEPHKHNDHTCDETRYFFMSQPEIIFTRDTSPVHSRMPIEATVAAARIMRAGEEEKQYIEWDEGIYTHETGSVQIDEHLGGIW